MAPIVKEPEVPTSAQANLEGTALAAGKPQAAAAEISVTVNGARTAAGGNKREPFSENTSTVLVFPKGAVIRLASAVAAGQLLFLTNEKTKKEVVCQVVKAKSEGSASGYVELQFTEPAAGFWGMRFPGSLPATALPAEAKPLAPVTAPPLEPLEEKLAEMITRRVSTPATDTARTGEQRPNTEPAAKVPVTKQSGSGAPAIPTLSQFLSQGKSGPQLKVSEKSSADHNSSNAEPSVQEPRTKTGEPQKSLSMQLINAQPAKPKDFAPPVEAALPDQKAKPAEKFEQKDSLSKLLLAPPAAVNPAPGTSTFDFGADEVKIPAWLEPLARNSAVRPPSQESKSHESYDPPAKSTEDWAAGDKASEGLVASPVSETPGESEAVPSEHSAGSGATASALSSEGPTPNFGLSLALDKRSEQPTGTGKGSNGGLLFGLLAAALLLAAGGGWYWYSNQPVDGSSNGTSSVKTDAVQPEPAVTPSVAPSSDPAKSLASPKAPEADSSRATASLPPARTENKEMGSPFTPRSSANDFDPATPATKPAVPGPEKKPSIGKVHLAAPVLSRRADANGSSDPAPALSGNGVSAIDASNLGALASKSSQPMAPVTVGGDVKPARLLSSVAPIYPQLARNQRLSGDVKLDALIDASGRVSSTKIISGPALLHQAAMDAVRQWKYQPATLNGTPMPMHLAVTVQFKAQ